MWYIGYVKESWTILATSWNEHFYLKLFKSVLYQVSQALPRAVGQFHIPILLVATITKEMMDMVGKVIDMVEEVAKPQFISIPQI